MKISHTEGDIQFHHFQMTWDEWKNIGNTAFGQMALMSGDVLIYDAGVEILNVAMLRQEQEDR